MARLAHGETVADVGRRHETQRADESGSAIGENVTVEVGGDDHVVCGGLAEELVDHRVDDLLLDLDAGVPELGLLEGFAGGGAEQAVGLREDVALVCDGDDGALGGVGAGAVADALPPGGDLAGHVGDAVAGALGDALDGLGDLAVGAVVGLLLLDVQVLGVLADDDEVDWVGEGSGGSDGLDGPHVRVQVQALAEADDGAAVALGGSRRRAAMAAVSKLFTRRVYSIACPQRYSITACEQAWDVLTSRHQTGHHRTPSSKSQQSSPAGQRRSS